MILRPRNIKASRFAARDTLSDVARTNEAFYADNYAGELRNLRDTALGLRGTQGDAYAASQEGIATASRLYDVAAGGLGRADARMGRAPMADVAANRGKRLSLARIISQVDAGNRGTERAVGIQRDAAEQGTQLYNALSNNSSRILADIAMQETDRDAQERGAKAAKRAGTLGAIGTGLGIAATVASFFV